MRKPARVYRVVQAGGRSGRFSPQTLFLMQDTKGKVIFSLLAGATAGIVAGLLLAPETGDEARADIKESAGKLNKDLARLLKEGKARLDSFTGKPAAATGQQQADRTAADDLLSSMNQPAGPGAGI